MSKIPLALIGAGKIAADQHIPALAQSPDFELVAAVDFNPAIELVPTFGSIESMLTRFPQVRAVSICTPPRGRAELLRAALSHGLHVMLEKPPAATIGEAESYTTLALEAGKSVFTSWHSREAAAVGPALLWLDGKAIRQVAIEWKEDVRVWHPGQEWIWQPGIGVFDPGINALSVITKLLPDRVVLKSAALRFPANRAAPIAADLEFTSGNAQVSAAFDFDQRGPQTWTIEIVTDGGVLKLHQGASRMTVDGAQITVGDEGEYLRLYRHFATLIAEGRNDIDLTPFHLVADAFLLGTRSVTGPFSWV